MNKLKKLLLISSALLLSTANNTFAAGESAATIAASGTITGSCTFTASAMAFTLSTSATTTATSNIVPTCTNGTAYTIKNTADSQYMSRSGASPTPVEGDANTVGFTIVVTATGQAFTATNGAGANTGKLTGEGNGNAQTLSAALTGTAESGAGKVAGIYAGTASLTIVY